MGERVNSSGEPSDDFWAQARLLKLIRDENAKEDFQELPGIFPPDQPPLVQVLERIREEATGPGAEIALDPTTLIMVRREFSTAPDGRRISSANLFFYLPDPDSTPELPASRQAMYPLGWEDDLGNSASIGSVTEEQYRAAERRLKGLEELRRLGILPNLSADCIEINERSVQSGTAQLN